MRIVYFHQYFNTLKGSGGTRSYYVAKELIKYGHQVKMVCLNDSRSKTGLEGEFNNGIRVGQFEGIEIVEINIPYSNNLNLIKRSIVFLKYSFICTLIAIKENCDLIFATSTPLTVAIPGIFAKIIRSRKFVFEVRDLWPETPIALGLIKNPFVIICLLLLENVAYYTADKCIGLAPGICRGIEKKGFNKKNIYMIPNASDIELFKPLNANQKKEPKFLSNYGHDLSSNSFIAAFTGAHGIANGLDSLIDVALELKRKNRNDIKILFIGEGKIKKRLQQRAIIEDLNNCIFIDSMPKTELSKLLRKSVNVGLMVLKNIPEFYNGTSPNKFFDYISCGLPIINNYPGWIADLINKNDLGFTVKPNDSRDFANALIFLADNKKEFNKKGINSRKLALEKYSSQELAKNVRLVIEELNIK